MYNVPCKVEWCTPRDLNLQPSDPNVYQESLDGLVVAEVGFEPAEDSKRFSQSAWFGEEVTEDQHYKNSSLALKGRLLPSPYR